MKIDDLRVELTRLGFTEDQVKQLEPIFKSEKDESYNAGVGNAYENVDKEINSLFGVEKQGREMSTIYLRNSFNMFKQGFEADIDKKYESIKSKNKELEEQLKSVPDAAKYDSLQKTYNEAIENHKLELQKLETNFNNQQKRSKIEMFIKSLPFDEKHDKDYVNFKTKSLIDDIEKRGFEVEEVNGKIMLKGGESEGHRSFELSEFAKEPLAGLLKSETTPPRLPNAPQGLSSIKSKEEFYTGIRKGLEDKGLKITDDNWDSAYQKEIEANKSILESIPE